jgi:VIT1/CCC1 family predicted Fe2+/Mn2+ transporter
LTLVQGLLITLGVVIFSVLGLLVARRWLDKYHPELKGQHDITDPYSQFVAMLFAVLLGFMVADSMQRFGEARETVQQEASSLANVFRLAEGLPKANHDRLRDLCYKYAYEVVNDEWAMLALHKDSPKAWVIYRQLWNVCTTYEPTTQRQSNTQTALLDAMESLGNSRRMRIEALHAGLPKVLWAVLFLGGAATILFTYFFAAENLKIQIIMVSMVSLVICLNLFLLASYDDPFNGDVRVTPSAFETQLNLFKLEQDLEAKAGIVTPTN